MKEAVTDQAKLRLRELLEANSRLSFPRPTSPQLSILLVLHNRAELTLACLRSIQPCLRELAAEVILVDNASRDETSLLLDRLRGATVIRNSENVGFPVGVNQAAEAAGGDFLLLLNNDTEVQADSVRSALRFLVENPDVGAAGGRIVLLDGTLQEAGCSLYREGHVLQYGRGDRPTAPEYLFQRDVDYCSAAFLMTRRELFRKMGGLDTAFSPGYFEDVDYCVRLWRCGWRVVYLPDVLVRHYENASSSCWKRIVHLYRRNHLIFTHKHADWLSWKCPAATTPHLRARSSHDDRFKVLYLPTESKDASPTARIVGRLRSLSCFVTVYPVGEGADAVGLPPDVEVLPDGGLDKLSEFLAQRRGYYDCVLAGDPQILQLVRRFVARPAATPASL
ncbi:MAG TPA: glycosyltransferase family 2 protein [Gemmataceae bacterium]|nr:glycosyltransferase family 2 protein [Gemmataceae bacterium]